MGKVIESVNRQREENNDNVVLHQIISYLISRSQFFEWLSFVVVLIGESSAIWHCFVGVQVPLETQLRVIQHPNEDDENEKRAWARSSYDDTRFPAEFVNLVGSTHPPCFATGFNHRRRSGQESPLIQFFRIPIITTIHGQGHFMANLIQNYPIIMERSLQHDSVIWTLFWTALASHKLSQEPPGK